MLQIRQSLKKLHNLAFGNSKYTPIILLSTARTGSNLLRSYLNNHPNIRVDGEILKRLNNKDSEKIINKTWGLQAKHLQAVGFKLFYGHPFDESEKQSWQYILHKQDLHIIHLKRNNAVRSFISERIASINDEWLNKNPNQPIRKEPIFYNPEKMVRKLNQLDQEMAWAESYFEEKPIIDVEFNELTQDNDRVMRQITDFLRVEFIPTTTPLIRQNPEPLSKLVTNWDEITSALKGSKWEKFLNE